MIQDDDAAVVGKGGKAVISIEKEPMGGSFPTSISCRAESLLLLSILAGD